MMNLLSWEKKKKLPDFPDPSPALNAYSQLNSGARESYMILLSILSHLQIKVKI